MRGLLERFRRAPLVSAAVDVGRRPIGLRVIAVSLYGYFLYLISIGGHSQWGRLWIPIMPSSFADTRSITSAWECIGKGIDRFPSNPCDPWGRDENYPRIWLWPGHLGLGQSSTVALGLATCLVFFASVLIVFRRTTLLDSLICSAAVVSPAVMLGVERGNADLIVFSVLVLGIFLFRCTRAGTSATGHGVILAAAMLKLFPAFAFAVLLRQSRRRQALGLGVVLAAFAIYGLVTLSDIRAIQRILPQPIGWAFGASVAPRALSAWLSAHHLSLHGFRGYIGSHHSALVLLVLATTLSAWLAWRRRRLVETSARAASANSFELDAFVAGAAIFIGSFALVANWDYRLVFLLLTIPQLLRWTRSDSSPIPAPRLTLLAIVGTLWLSEIVTRSMPLPYEEVLNWTIFVTLLSALFVLLAPALSTWPLIRRRARTPLREAT